MVNRNVSCLLNMYRGVVFSINIYYKLYYTMFCNFEYVKLILNSITNRPEYHAYLCQTNEYTTETI